MPVDKDDLVLRLLGQMDSKMDLVNGKVDTLADRLETVSANMTHYATDGACAARHERENENRALGFKRIWETFEPKVQDLHERTSELEKHAPVWNDLVPRVKAVEDKVAELRESAAVTETKNEATSGVLRWVAGIIALILAAIVIAWIASGKAQLP